MPSDVMTALKIADRHRVIELWLSCWFSMVAGTRGAWSWSALASIFLGGALILRLGRMPSEL